MAMLFGHYERSPKMATVIYIDHPRAERCILLEDQEYNNA